MSQNKLNHAVAGAPCLASETLGSATSSPITSTRARNLPHSFKTWGTRIFGALALAAVTCSAQQTAPVAPVDSQVPLPKGKVLFERHETPVSPDEDPGQTAPVADPATPANPTQAKPGISSSSRHPRTLKRRTDEPEDPAPEVAPVVITEAPLAASSSSVDPAEVVAVTTADLAASARVTATERAAPQVTRTDLDLHLNAHSGEVETRAQLVIRNAGSAPMARLPLRVSGALHWESARSGAVPLKIEQHHIADDLDHTGVGTELLLTLPQPVAPGATVPLDLYYGGTITASAARLTAIGAPAGRAALTDWDTVSDTFTGLRGLGDVLWYPVTTPPALLKDREAVPQAVAAARIANAASSFRLDLTLEYTGSRPDAAFFSGERVVLRPLGGVQPAAANAVDPGVVTATWSRAALGPHTPSLFVAQAAPHLAANALLRVVTDRAETAAALGEAATRLRPMMSEWLGAAPLSAMDALDLPIPGAAGFSDGTLLVAPLGTAPTSALAPSLVQPVAAAWMPPNVEAAWLREGIPAFLQAVWAERSQGRAVALSGLAANAAALQSQVAPAPAPAFSSSQDAQAAGTTPPLATCAEPACARARAAYVFEMLRSMLGDSALQQAISGWRQRRAAANAPGDTSPAGPTAHANATETADMEQMLQQVAGKRDLGWFFRGWIDSGNNLPDLSIVTVAPRRVERNAPVDYLPARKPVGGPIGAEPVPQVGDPTYEAERKPIAPGDRIAPAVGSWLVAVEVQNTGDTEAEVPVTVRAGDLTNSLPLRVPAHGRATIRVPFEADPQEVMVNDGSVPEARASTHRRTITNLPPQR